VGHFAISLDFKTRPVGSGLRLKLVFRRSADGTDPVVGQVLEGGAGAYPVVRVAGFRIVHISAHHTFVFLHEFVTSFFVEKIDNLVNGSLDI
jgi:hypothetical protein